MSATSMRGVEEPAGREVWSWTIEPAAGWLVVPSTATEAPEAVSAWEAETVELVFGLIEAMELEGAEGEDPALSDERRAELRQAITESVADLRGYADGVPPEGGRVAAAVGVLDRSPVPVLVVVARSDPDHPDDELMTTLGATGGTPVAPPKIDYLDLPDGDGIRVTRTDIDRATGGAWVSISVGRRTEHPDAVVDTLLLCRTPDIAAVPAIVEALDVLLPAVRIIRSTP